MVVATTTVRIALMIPEFKQRDAQKVGVGGVEVFDASVEQHDLEPGKAPPGRAATSALTCRDQLRAIDQHR